jgi:hypothetical protein
MGPPNTLDVVQNVGTGYAQDLGLSQRARVGYRLSRQHAKRRKDLEELKGVHGVEGSWQLPKDIVLEARNMTGQAVKAAWRR